MGSAQSFEEIELDSGGFNQDYARAYEVAPARSEGAPPRSATPV
jgi:hypothetical protein